MKLTNKYCLCDLCSEFTEVSKCEEYLYFPGSRALIFLREFRYNIARQDEFSTEDYFQLLDKTEEKDICNICQEKLDSLFSVEMIPFYFREKDMSSFSLFSESSLSEPSLRRLLLMGLRTNGAIDFAEAKNQKIAEIQFASINALIKEMIEEKGK